MNTFILNFLVKNDCGTLSDELVFFPSFAFAFVSPQDTTFTLRLQVPECSMIEQF